MNRFWPYTLWGVACYLLFLVAALPAEWVYERMHGWIAPLRLTGLSGTLWSGGFQTLEFGQGRAGPGRWQVRWSDLLLGRLSVDGSLGQENQPGPWMRGRLGVVGASALFVEQATLRLQLAEIRGFVPWLPPNTQGRLQGNLDELIANESGFLALRGRGEVTGLSIGSPLDVALGDLTGEVSTGADRGLLLRLTDRDGPLRLQATFRVQPDGQYRLRGVAAVKNQTDERLANLLRMMGPMDPTGQVNLNESGRLPGFL